jgi:hypothetical protein
MDSYPPQICNQDSLKYQSKVLLLHRNPRFCGTVCGSVALSCYVFSSSFTQKWGHVVAKMVEVLCYKPEGHWIES